MATRNWLGGQHSFFDPNAWSPFGAPIAGDVAIIGPGSASAANVASASGVAIDGITVLLDDGPGATGSAFVPTLSLSNAVIGSGTVVENAAETSPLLGATDTEQVLVGGMVWNRGTIGENPSAPIGNTLNIVIQPGATLVNGVAGRISGTTIAQLNIEGGRKSALVNNGVISGQGTTLDVGVAVSGSGSFDMTKGGNPGSASGTASQLEFHKAVGPGETIAVNDTTLVLDAPMRFLAKIDDTSVTPPGRFATNSAILLAGEQATALQFQDNVLTVWNGATMLADLRFAAGLNGGDFTLSNTTRGAEIAIAAPSGGSASATAQSGVVMPVIGHG